MRIMHEETFGPVMVISRVKDEAEAIALANATEFGHNASVYSKSSARAKRIGEHIEAGGTCINAFGLTYMAQALPFGGIKGSGFGRLNGREGLRACTVQKSVLTDRLPIHVATALYPVGPRDYDKARATIRMLYRRGLRSRLSQLWALIKLSRA